MTYQPTLEAMPHTWDSQEAQHPSKGKPGITVEQHEIDVAWVEHKPSGASVAIPSGCPVDVIFYRSRKGTLIGILYHYPVDVPPWEKAGNVNVWVHPRRQRRGIGTALVTEAMARWDINFDQQDYTPDGAALINAVMGRKEVAA